MQELNIEIMSNGKEIIWHHKKRRKKQTGLHYQDFYEFCLVLDGRAVNQVNNVTKVLNKGDVIFVNKNTIHEVVSADIEPAFKYINIAFGEKYMKKIHTIFPSFKSELHFNVVHLEQERINKLIDMYSYINLNMSYEEAILEMELFLYHVIKEMLTTNSSRKKMFPRWLEVLLDKCNDTNSLHEGCSYIFENSPYSKQYTIRNFKTFLNVTPSEYINLRRVAYASQLLSTDKKVSITDVCFESGFQNVEYFDKVFKKYKNMTPLNYHKEMMKLIGKVESKID